MSPTIFKLHLLNLATLNIIVTNICQMDIIIMRWMYIFCFYIAEINRSQNVWWLLSLNVSILKIEYVIVKNKFCIKLNTNLTYITLIRLRYKTWLWISWIKICCSKRNISLNICTTSIDHDLILKCLLFIYWYCIILLIKKSIWSKVVIGFLKTQYR